MEQRFAQRQFQLIKELLVTVCTALSYSGFVFYRRLPVGKEPAKTTRLVKPVLQAKVTAVCALLDLKVLVAWKVRLQSSASKTQRCSSLPIF